jgi:hypothetical protein
MKQIERSELLGLGEYEAIRERFYQRIVESKRPRRMRLGDEMSIVFENRDTVLFQVQEMLRTERITAEKAIAHELETYNPNVPGDDELSATLFIEVPDLARRNELLMRLCAIEEHVSLEVEGRAGIERCRATFEEGRRDKGRAAAVQYLKFPLTLAAAAMLRARDGAFSIRVDHPHFQARFALTAATVESLAGDLA